MAVRHSGDNLPSNINSDLGACTICCQGIDISTAVETVCKHIFHKLCILEWIQTSPSCPQCRSKITKNSLKSLTEPCSLLGPIPTTTVNITPTTTIVTQPSTSGTIPRVLGPRRTLRSDTRNQQNQNTQPSQPISSNLPTTQTSNNNTPLLNPLDWTLNISRNSLPRTIETQANNHSENNVLENRITQIESRLNSEFSSLQETIQNLTQQLVRLNTRAAEPEWPREVFPPLNPILETQRDSNNISSDSLFTNNQNNSAHSLPSNSVHSYNNPNINSNINSVPSENVNQNVRTSQNNVNTQFNNSFGNIAQRNSYLSNPQNHARIAQLMQSWKVTFSGCLNKMPVGKFIYMINSLTHDSLGGNFSVLCEHLHILFSDKGLDWYWRYRRTVPNIDWDNLCEAMRVHFRDHLSDDDVKELIRNRKQGDNEDFEKFYTAILYLCDRLIFPFSDYELLCILRRNLKPQLRNELFYLNINSVAHLRHLILRREVMYSDNDRSKIRRQIHEVETSTDDISYNDTAEICELRKIICFNCRQEGHVYKNCIETPRIFCYGCGADGIYKPNCEKCKNSGNATTSVTDPNRLRSRQQ